MSKIEFWFILVLVVLDAALADIGRAMDHMWDYLAWVEHVVMLPFVLGVDLIVAVEGFGRWCNLTWTRLRR